MGGGGGVESKVAIILTPNVLLECQKNVQSDYRGPKRVLGVLNVPQEGLKLPT